MHTLCFRRWGSLVRHPLQHLRLMVREGTQQCQESTFCLCQEKLQRSRLHNERLC